MILAIFNPTLLLIRYFVSAPLSMKSDLVEAPTHCEREKIAIFNLTNLNKLCDLVCSRFREGKIFSP